MSDRAAENPHFLRAAINENREPHPPVSDSPDFDIRASEVAGSIREDSGKTGQGAKSIERTKAKDIGFIHDAYGNREILDGFTKRSGRHSQFVMGMQACLLGFFLFFTVGILPEGGRRAGKDENG